MLSTFMLHFISIVLAVLAFSSLAATSCHDTIADIILAIDSSYSLHNDDFQSQLVFVKSLIDSFPIRSGDIRLGLVLIGSTPVEYIPLAYRQNPRDLKMKVGKTQRLLDQGTMTHKVIHMIHNQMFQSRWRPGVKRLLVLITDGRSENETSTLEEASEARSKGIEIFTIGVGASRNNFELNAVASEPRDDHVFNVDSFKALHGIKKSLVSSICHKNQSHQILETVSECLYKSADVVFVLDSSSSIHPDDFEGLATFVQNVMESFDIDVNLTRVGLVSYSEASMVITELGDIRSKYDVVNHRPKPPHITGNTDTAKALRFAWTRLLEGGQSSRPDAAQILVLLTDGQSDDDKEAAREASFLQSQGVDIFTVTLVGPSYTSEHGNLVNNEDYSEHGNLVNNEDYYFRVNASDLSTLHTQLAIRTCQAMPSVMSALCPEVATDVVFIYDSTTVNGPHHDFIINVITEVVRSSGLGSEDLRFGVIRDAPIESKASLDIELTNHWTESDFKNELDLDAKKAAIDLLLQKVRVRYFQPLSRVAEKKIVILFLDSNLANKIGAYIEAMRLKRSHVRIIVVAMGKHVDMNQVSKLASEPRDRGIIPVPFIHSERTLNDVTHKLLHQILCD